MRNIICTKYLSVPQRSLVLTDVLFLQFCTCTFAVIIFWFLTKAACATFSRSRDTFYFMYFSSVVFSLLCVTMAFPVSFLIRSCKFAMKIQQSRHKMYFSVLTWRVTIKEMITLYLPTTNFLLKEFCVAFSGVINTVFLLVPFKQTLFQIIGLLSKIWVEHGMRNLEIWTESSNFSPITLSFTFFF